MWQYDILAVRFPAPAGPRTSLRQALIRGGDEALAEDKVRLVEQHAVLLEVSRIVSSDLSLDILLPNLVDFITRTLRVEGATLFLHDPKKDELYSRALRGEKVEEIHIPAKSGIAGAVFNDHEVLNIPEGFEPVAMIAVGYQGEADTLSDELRERETAPRSRKALAEIVSGAGWGDSPTSLE